MSSNDNSSPQSTKPRKRGLTEVTLGWIADRFRRAQKVKAQLAEGTYNVDSSSVAKAIVNQPEENK